MNHQHHLKSDPKFGRFSRFSRGGGARSGARGMPRVMRIAMIVVGHGYKAFGVTVVRPSGLRSQGLRGFVRPSGVRAAKF